MDLVLTPDLEQLIDEQLAHGRLKTPKEVVREALLLLRERMTGDVPRSQQVRVAGRLDAVHAETLSFEIVLERGERIQGTLTDPEAVHDLLGETVVVSGLAFFQPSGKVERIEAELVEQGQGDVAFWSRPPRPLLGRLKRSDLDRSPKLRLGDVMGQWPGDESDEDVFAALEELS